MTRSVINIDNISKRYRLGTISTGRLRQDLNLWWKSNVLKKRDPFYHTGDGEYIEDTKDHLWALKNVSFDIKEGEVCGIVGRNGAGKSTLLKILSRITRPTYGVVKGVGKISSLLEVGTGFHPELTGRENIYISGSMLGMKKAEIKAQFDEIVDFSGISQFIDTPVKRYSSGMYVRLAFGVAAHLNPDILIVDEVLAVGDAEFQKKCLGKMKDVSTKKGRTIIFVSHNMQAITNLCSRAIWLQKGSIHATGEVQAVVNKYLSAYQKKLWKQQWNSLKEAPGNQHIRVMSIELIPHLPDPLSPIDIRTPLTIKFCFKNFNSQMHLSVNLALFTLAGECVFNIPSSSGTYEDSVIEGECTIPGRFLNDGSYYISLYFIRDTSRAIFEYEECLHFDVEDYRENISRYDKWQGYVRPHFPFELKESDSTGDGLLKINPVDFLEKKYPY
jgi:lipopolysaccharide transport system ATP-binding protein